MSKRTLILKLALISSLLTAPAVFAEYNSGSTGVDGDFNPTASQAIQLPADGIFNYTSVNIPSGVTITYIKNAANTPVTILSATDVTIAGTIDVSAVTAGLVSGGLGGPGGFDGGKSGTPVIRSSWVDGYASPNVGRAGVGPGAGSPATVDKVSTSYFGSTYSHLTGGGGGAYGTIPVQGSGVCQGTNGSVYGNESLTPLIGGSGGGGGAGGVLGHGSGGGGGGGAILIAASSTINVTGEILANGGTPGGLPSWNTVNARGSNGGGGSGGAIRLIATTVNGNGTISAQGGHPTPETKSNSTIRYGVCSSHGANETFNGGDGRIRIDADTIDRTASTIPGWSSGVPTLAFVPGLPTLTIASIGGVTVPTGNSNIDLPFGFSNPVTVNFVTQGVTIGSSIKLIITPAQGQAFSVTSAPTTGSNESGAASVTVELEQGANTMQATVTYTVVASLGDALSNFAKGERVESVTLASILGSKSAVVTLTTVTGKEFVVPASVLVAAKAKS